MSTSWIANCIPVFYVEAYFNGKYCVHVLAFVTLLTKATNNIILSLAWIDTFCEVEIFFVSAEANNVISILISSDFLKMDALVGIGLCKIYENIFAQNCLALTWCTVEDTVDVKQ